MKRWKPYMGIGVVLVFWAAVASVRPAEANGPAWVAELSDPSPARAQQLEVWTLAGEPVTVIVHDTDAVDVAPPEGVSAEVFDVMYEHRTLFQGYPQEREGAIAYYLPPRRWNPTGPTGNYAVRLTPSLVGTYEVPIKCNVDTVTVTLRVPDVEVAKADVGFGVYLDSERFAYPEHARLYYRDMVAHGMNTGVMYGRAVDSSLGPHIPRWQSEEQVTPAGSTRSYFKDQREHWRANMAQHVAWRMDALIEEGLIDPKIPMFNTSGGGRELSKCRPLSKYPDRWPETLLWMTIDEPAPEAAGPAIAAFQEGQASTGRSGCALGSDSCFAYGRHADVWIVMMQRLTTALIDKAERDGAEIWVYNCHIRGTNAPLHRYYTGAWTLKVRHATERVTPTLVNLMWTYMHDNGSRINEDGTWHALRVCEHALGAPDGPVGTVGLEGYRDGVLDFRILRELERELAKWPRHKGDWPSDKTTNPYGIVDDSARWLQSVLDDSPLAFYPPGEGWRDFRECYSWDVPDTAHPRHKDFVGIRRKALEYLMELRKPENEAR